MKNCKGITMMSLIIYIGVFLAVIGVIAGISSFFYKNVVVMDSETTSDYEYNKLNLYLLEEVKKKGNNIERVKNESTETFIKFSSGNTFLFQTNKIYLVEDGKNTKIMLCDNVDDVTFATRQENQKTVLHMDITLKSLEKNDNNDDETSTKSTTYSTDYVLDYSN